MVDEAGKWLENWGEIPPRVLFVDDEPEILATMRQNFRRNKFKIFTAESGPEALELLKQHQFEVIVSDERMPQMSGSEFLTKVRSTQPNSMRILLTGQASIEAVAKAVNEGEIYRFLLKPIHKTVLLHAINQSLDYLALIAETQRLRSTVAQQEDRLRSLERFHPGITKVNRDHDGAILLDLEEYEV